MQARWPSHDAKLQSHCNHDEHDCCVQCYPARFTGIQHFSGKAFVLLRVITQNHAANSAHYRIKQNSDPFLVDSRFQISE